MNYTGFSRPVWSWLRGDDPPWLRTSLGHPGGLPDVGGSRPSRRCAVPRGRAVARAPALVDAARQPRHRPLPHRRRLARPPARRHRAADDDAGRADGLRRRRDRPRGRLGRGRAPHDAVGRGRRPGTRRCSRLPAADRAAPLAAPRSRAAASATRTSSADAIAYLRETPGERLLCLASRAPHDPPTPLARSAARARDALRRGRAVGGRRRPCCPATAPHSRLGLV